MNSFLLAGVFTMSLFSPSVQTHVLAEDTTIGSEWGALAPAQPIDVCLDEQSVVIEAGSPGEWEPDFDRGVFRKGGAEVKIEAVFVLRDNGEFAANRIGLGKGLILQHLPTVPVTQGSFLPAGDAVESVRLRSEPPIDGAKVSFVCQASK